MTYSHSAARAARLASELSVSEAARRLGISRDQVYRYEGAPRGPDQQLVVPSANVVGRMASVYGVPIASLFADGGGW